MQTVLKAVLFVITAALVMGLCIPMKAMAARADANAWHVAPNGDDANDGSSAESAFQTIQHGLAAMSGGGTLLIHSGTYRENLRIGEGLSGNSLNEMTTIAAAGDGEAIVDGGGAATDQTHNALLRRTETQQVNTAIPHGGVKDDTPASAPT